MIKPDFLKGSKLRRISAAGIWLGWALAGTGNHLPRERERPVPQLRRLARDGGSEKRSVVAALEAVLQLLQYDPRHNMLPSLKEVTG